MEQWMRCEELAWAPPPLHHQGPLPRQQTPVIGCPAGLTLGAISSFRLSLTAERALDRAVGGSAPPKLPPTVCNLQREKPAKQTGPSTKQLKGGHTKKPGPPKPALQPASSQPARQVGRHPTSACPALRCPCRRKAKTQKPTSSPNSVLLPPTNPPGSSRRLHSSCSPFIITRPISCLQPRVFILRRGILVSAFARLRSRILPALQTSPPPPTQQADWPRLCLLTAHCCAPESASFDRSLVYRYPSL